MFCPPTPVRIPSSGEALGYRVDGNSPLGKVFFLLDVKHLKEKMCFSHDGHQCDTIHNPLTDSGCLYRINRQRPAAIGPIESESPGKVKTGTKEGYAFWNSFGH